MITPLSVFSHTVWEHMVKSIAAAGNKNSFLIDLCLLFDNLTKLKTGNET
jgi:hypothetical protein